MRVLVVEDNETMQRLFATALAREGMECILVSDGKSAVQAWQQEDFDLIFMDVQMPVMDGLEAARLVREQEKTRGGHTVIIGVTAFALDTERAMCLEAGMDDVVTKPINLNELFSVVKKHAKARA
jgi:CheY-like chemotaxis protein